jgi:tRNA(fMet)-specific endonuclease VapC
VRERFEAVDAMQIAATVISLEEQLRGWLGVIARLESQEQIVVAYASLRDTQSFYCALQLIGFDQPAETIYRSLRTTYRRLGKMDLRIAAIALATTATLVTRNERDFGQIAEITLQNWAST